MVEPFVLERAVAGEAAQRIGPAAAGRLCRMIRLRRIEPSTTPLPSVRALHGGSATGLAFPEKPIHPRGPLRIQRLC